MPIILKTLRALLLHAGQYDRAGAPKFYSGISELHPEGNCILFADDYKNHRGIPALPFSKLSCSVSKPVEDKRVRVPHSIGEHIRKRRLELGLLQREVAELIGVSENCLTYWENNRSLPQVHSYPTIVSFLGYYPFSIGSNLGDRIKHYRYGRGLTQQQLGKRLGVDGTTICCWETGETKPMGKYLTRLKVLIK